MKDNESQLQSRSYLLAVDDRELLLGEGMRAFRLALEYQKFEAAMQHWGIGSTVLVIGSARTPSPETARARLEAALGAEEVRAAERALRLSKHYQMAREFGRIASLQGGALVSGGTRSNVIGTGGGPGIMEAANRGATEAGAPTLGFNISLPFEQEPNAWTTPDLCFRFHYFAMRKFHMVARASCIVAFVGGFGTFDELFEVLVLIQVGRMPKIPVVLVGVEFWNEVINFRALADNGMISELDLGLFEIVDSAEAAWASLRRQGLQVPQRQQDPIGLAHHPV